MAAEFDIFKLPRRWSLADWTEQLVTLLPEGVIWTFARFLIGGTVQDVVQSPDDEWQDTHGYEEEIQDVVLEGDASGHYLRRLLSCFASELERFEDACWSLVNQTDPGVATDILEDWERQLGLPEDCYADIALTIEDRQRQAHAKLFDTGKTTTEAFYEDIAGTLGFDITVEEIPEDSQPRIMGVAIMGVEPMGGGGGNSILRITINSGTGDSDLLRCVINRYKQAHITIVWVE